MIHFVKPEIRQIVIERDKACVYCGKPVARVSGNDAPYNIRWKAYDDQGNVFHFEHRIPMVAGGANDESNICLACAPCNLEKARGEKTARAYKGEKLMSKTIKLDDPIYGKLTALMQPKETYSQVVERILTLFDKMGELRDVLEGAVAFQNHKREVLEQQKHAD
jgi:predicted CopG family antitoxin